MSNSSTTMNKGIKVLTLIGACAFTLAAAHAQTTWVGGVGNWHIPSNWSSGNVPTGSSGGMVLITSGGAEVSINAAAATQSELQVFAATAPAPVLNIGADLAVGSALRVGHGSNSEGVVNQMAGDVGVVGAFVMSGGTDSNASYTLSGGSLTMGSDFNIGRNTNSTSYFMQTGGGVTVGNRFYMSFETGSTSYYTLRDGELNATGEFNMSRGSGSTSEFLMEGGKVTVGGLFRMGEGTNSTSHFTQTGGTVLIEGGNYVQIGHSSGTSVYTMKGGQLENEGDYNFLVGLNAPGTLVKYPDAQMVLTTTGANADAPFEVGKRATGTIRAVLDGGAYTPIDVAEAKSGSSVRLFDTGFHANAAAHLEVGLDGGVMVSGSTTFNLIEMAGSIWGDWTAKPGDDAANDLWLTSHEAFDYDGTGSGTVVQIALNEAVERGSLDASHMWSKVSFDPAVTGYVDLTNVDPGELLYLGLHFADTSDAGQLALFTDGLTETGRSWWELGEWAVGVTFDPAQTGADYFAFDLAAFNNSPGLVLEAVSVVPEPGTGTLLLLLGLVLLVKRRR